MRPGANPIEKIKAEKDGLDMLGEIGELAARHEGWETLDKGDRERLKWIGTFLRKPTPGQFMMRVRITNGQATSTQLRALAEIAGRLGNGFLDLTTPAAGTAAGHQAGRGAGDPGGAAGDRPELLSDGHGQHTQRKLLPAGGADGWGALRRLSGRRRIHGHLSEEPGVHQLASEVQRDDHGLPGELHAQRDPRHCDDALPSGTRTGRQGSTWLSAARRWRSRWTSLRRRTRLGAWPPRSRCSSATRVRGARGPRPAWPFLVQEWGVEHLRAKLEERWGTPLARAGRDARSARRTDHLGVQPQGQDGLHSVGLCVPTGRIESRRLSEVADLADRYGTGEDSPDDVTSSPSSSTSIKPSCTAEYWVIRSSSPCRPILIPIPSRRGGW